MIPLPAQDRRKDAGNAGMPKRLAMSACITLFMISVLLLALPSYGNAQTTSLVTVSYNNAQLNASSQIQDITPDGKLVLYFSFADNIIQGLTSSNSLFIRDLVHGTNRSVAPGGADGVASFGCCAAISANGGYVGFVTDTVLTPGDTNDAADVFVRDLVKKVTERVSVGQGGKQADGFSRFEAISGDGRLVVFASAASNLVPNDRNGQEDLFIRDRVARTTQRVSISVNGSEANGASLQGSISADGRYVAFASGASNLIANDTNGLVDVFVRDRYLCTTERVSIGSGGRQAHGASRNPDISADGRFVVFESEASDLAPADTNGATDVFLHARSSGHTTRVSVGPRGLQANGTSGLPAISDNNRYVAFVSSSTNLVPRDTNDLTDVFVHDLKYGRTKRVSVGPAGIQANDGLFGPSVSITSDGHRVIFSSNATNLIKSDVNGASDVFFHDW